MTTSSAIDQAWQADDSTVLRTLVDTDHAQHFGWQELPDEALDEVDEWGIRVLSGERPTTIMVMRGRFSGALPRCRWYANSGIDISKLTSMHK